MDINNLFNEFFNPISLALLVMLLVAFLIGLLLGWFIWGTQVRKLKREIARLNAELAAANKEILELRERLNASEAEVRRALAELEEWKKRNKELEVEKGNLHGEIFTMRADWAKEKEAWLAADAEKGNSTQNSLALQQRLAELEKAIAKSKLDADVLATHWTAREADYSQRLSAAAESHEQAQEKIAALQKRIGELEADARDEGRDEARPLVFKNAQAVEDVKKLITERLPAASADDADDLKIILGIGPFIERKLHALGIYTFEQIAKFDDEMIERVTEAIEFFPGRIKRDDWMEQAAQLHREKMG